MLSGLGASAPRASGLAKLFDGVPRGDSSGS